jgi:hypothetical protein
MSRGGQGIDKAPPSSYNQASLSRPCKGVRQDPCRFGRVSTCHAGEADEDRRRSSSQKFKEAGRRLPGFPLIEKPVACYAYCLRPIHRRANHVRAKAHQHGHIPTIGPHKIACEQRACWQFQCLPTPLAHYAAEQQSRNHSERHVCEPVIPGPKLQVGSHNVWKRTCSWRIPNLPSFPSTRPGRIVAILRFSDFSNAAIQFKPSYLKANVFSLTR